MRVGWSMAGFDSRPTPSGRNIAARSQQISRGDCQVHRKRNRFMPTIDRLDVRAVPSGLDVTGVSGTPSAMGNPAAVGVNDDPAELKPYLSTFTDVGDLAGPTRPFVPSPTITPAYVGTPTLTPYEPSIYDPNGIEIVPSYGKPVWMDNMTLTP